MGKRPRVKIEGLVLVTADKLEFTKNRCSDNARHIITYVENLEINIWFDKHYFARQHHGDDLGKREGIDLEIIQELIQHATKHLLYYCLRIQKFTFVNFTGNTRATRIVIQQNSTSGETLNVAVEYHCISNSKYEATVKTAMRTNNFILGDNQYILEIFNKDSSMLRKFENKRIADVSEYSNFI